MKQVDAKVGLANNFSDFTTAVTAALTQGMRNDNKNNFNNNSSNNNNNSNNINDSNDQKQRSNDKKEKRSILKFLLFAKTDGMNVSSDNVTDVKNFYYTQKNSRNDLIDTYNELEKNGASDEKIWKELIGFCELMKKQIDQNNWNN